MRNVARVTWLAAVCVGIMSGPLAAAPCGDDPIAVPPTRHPVYFSEPQEMDLGDAIAEHFERFYQVVEDDTNDALQALGERLVRQFPATQLTFRFRLVNLPSANAFTIPGGRIYVSRKLVSLARTEDELAGVLAHEIAHAIARHGVAVISAQFRQALDVTTFGDRKDIFDKYRQLSDSRPRIYRPARHEEQEQVEADRLALVAVARAGYAPAALPELWDRLLQTEQRTGNFFTDLFGLTAPESRRLRAMLRSVTGLRSECLTSRPPDGAVSFAEWQRRVTAGTPAERKASMHAVLHERPLEPPLRGDIVHLKFSDDGRHALAQDDSTIYVLSRDPFEVLFQIEAEGARPALFTPDGREIVFDTFGLRVERWDLASRSRVAVHELHVNGSCVQSTLARDARFWACIDQTLTILLLDVATGEVRYSRQWRYALSPQDLYLLSMFDALSGSFTTGVQAEVFELTFSPDSRYLVIGNFAADIVVETETRKEADLPGAVRRAFRQSFSFLGSDRLVTVDPKRPERSAVLRFPSGQTVKHVTLGGRVTAATRGDFVMIRPIKEWPVGLVDLATGQVIQASRQSAFDVFEQLRLGVQPNGDLGLYMQGSSQPIAVAALPPARLGSMTAADVSADLKWLAISARERGAVWNVESGSRTTLIAGFSGAYLAADGGLYADFPPRKKSDGATSPRAIVRLDLARNETSHESRVESWRAIQRRRYLFDVKPPENGDLRRKATFEARDVTREALLWSRLFPDEPPRWYFDAGNDRLIFHWNLSSFAAKSELRTHPALREQAEKRRLKEGDAYLEVLNAADGAVIGRLVVSTGRQEWKISDAASSGDFVVLDERPNQVSVYSLSTGERLGAAFGQAAAISAGARLVCVQNKPGELTFLDPGSMERLSGMHVSAGVRLARFSDDGRRLLIVTADQVARVFDAVELRKDGEPR